MAHYYARMSNQSDALIIGAGVIGCGTALELARRGMSVTVVDKLPSAGYGSTSSSSGIIRFHYSTEAGVAMAWEGFHYWKDWAAHVRAVGPDALHHEALIEIVELPMFMLFNTSEGRPPYLDHFDKFGLPYEVSPRDVVEEWPTTIDTRRFGPPARMDHLDDPFWGEPTERFDEVLLMPNTGYVTDPQLAAQNLYTAAVAEGVTFRFKHEVVAINRDDSGSRVAGVTLAGGEEVNASIVVNIAGPHSAKVNAMAGVDGEMARAGRALRREVYLGPAPAGFDNTTGFLGGDFDVGVYYRPETGGNIMIGSVEPECDELEWVDPDSFDETLSEDEFQLAMMRASRRLSDLAIPHSKRGLVALYDATDDWTPIYDRSSLDGYYMACGTSGNQFKNAAVAGHVMAELIGAVEAGHDHDAEAVVVTGRYTGLEIDTATFSRLREIDASAANTVFG